MKRVSLRQARVGDQIRDSIAELLLRRVKDPRVEGVTITGVDVSVDLKEADVYYCVYDESRLDQVLDGLKSAEGFLRYELKKALKIRCIPELHFKFDQSFDYGLKIDKLLDGLEKHEGDS
ncbi:MAG: Ribosome-binding factor A [Deltaproteobacteria bacterium ADurb.Bin510]|nr:MAG: Ribosome-binding factor A [Deltaproteobacteria bacterium ADurb.Bin510]